MSAKRDVIAGHWGRHEGDFFDRFYIESKTASAKSSAPGSLFKKFEPKTNAWNPEVKALLEKEDTLTALISKMRKAEDYNFKYKGAFMKQSFK